MAAHFGQGESESGALAHAIPFRRLSAGALAYTVEAANLGPQPIFRCLFRHCYLLLCPGAWGGLIAPGARRLSRCGHWGTIRKGLADQFAGSGSRGGSGGAPSMELRLNVVDRFEDIEP